jgi:hypothetical protein
MKTCPLLSPPGHGDWDSMSCPCMKEVAQAGIGVEPAIGKAGIQTASPGARRHIAGNAEDLNRCGRFPDIAQGGELCIEVGRLGGGRHFHSGGQPVRGVHRLAVGDLCRHIECGRIQRLHGVRPARVTAVQAQEPAVVIERVGSGQGVEGQLFDRPDPVNCRRSRSSRVAGRGRSETVSPRAGRAWETRGR